MIWLFGKLETNPGWAGGGYIAQLVLKHTRGLPEEP